MQIRFCQLKYIHQDVGNGAKAEAICISIHLGLFLCTWGYREERIFCSRIQQPVTSFDGVKRQLMAVVAEVLDVGFQITVLQQLMLYLLDSGLPGATWEVVALFGRFCKRCSFHKYFKCWIYCLPESLNNKVKIDRKKSYDEPEYLLAVPTLSRNSAKFQLKFRCLKQLFTFAF